jgi:hypothetical protein
MKREFGKWLMDVAKYLMTAVILTSVLGEIKEKYMIVILSCFTVLLTLILGLYFVREPEVSNKNNSKKKRR